MNRAQRRHMGRHLSGSAPCWQPPAELPLVLTEPGCSSPLHVPDVFAASFAWLAGDEVAYPAPMRCGCRVLDVVSLDDFDPDWQPPPR